jgi:hypothetical protein
MTTSPPATGTYRYRTLFEPCKGFQRATSGVRTVSR